MKNYRGRGAALMCAMSWLLSAGSSAAATWEFVAEDNGSRSFYDSANVTHDDGLIFVVVKDDYKQIRAKLGDDGEDINYKVGLARVALHCPSLELWIFSRGFQDLNTGADVWDDGEFLEEGWRHHSRPVYGKMFPELMKRVCK